MSKDNVNHPSHYNSGRIEVIEAIEDWKLDYHRGCAVKYVARAGKKDPEKEIEDLQKAIWYLNRAIVVLDAAQNGITPDKPDNTPIHHEQELEDASCNCGFEHEEDCKFFGGG